MAKWSDDDLKRLSEMKARGAFARDIAEELGRTFKSVTNKIERSSLTPEMMKARRAAEYQRKKKYQKKRTFCGLPWAEKVYVVVPPKEVLEERAERYSAPPRDIAGALFGDPPRGFSALERRS